MTKEEQIQLFENKILEKRNIFLNSNEKNIYYNYSDLMTLELDYRLLTGNKQIIDKKFLDEFYKYNKVLVDGPMKDTYKRIQTFKNQIIDINLKELKNIALFDILEPVHTKINNNNLKRIANIEKSIDEDNLTYHDIDYIINDFLKTTNYKYKDLYKNLKEQGLVFFTNTGTTLGSCYNDIDYDSNYGYIIINKNQDIIRMCLTIAHELGHMIEILELKNNNINKEDYYKFIKNTIFDEVISTSYNKKCINYLENIGIDKTTIKKYRIQDFFNGNLGYANDVVTAKKDLYSIKRTYAMIINNYLSSIILPGKKEKLEKTFNEEKLLNNDIKILEKLKCNDRKIKSSTKKCLKKVL